MHLVSVCACQLALHYYLFVVVCLVMTVVGLVVLVVVTGALGLSSSSGAAGADIADQRLESLDTNLQTSDGTTVPAVAQGSLDVCIASVHGAIAGSV